MLRTYCRDAELLSAMRLRACSEISAQINSSLSKNSGGNGACRKQRELPTLDTSAAPYRSHKETKPMATTPLFPFYAATVAASIVRECIDATAALLAIALAAGSLALWTIIIAERVQ
jgi:hypothetical protein